MIGKKFQKTTTLTITEHDEETGVVKGINDRGAEIIMTVKQVDEIYIGRRWSELAASIAKDEKIPLTEEYFYKVMAMDDELIHEKQAEIAALKSKVNRLEQKLESKKAVIKVLNETNDKRPGGTWKNAPS